MNTHFLKKDGTIKKYYVEACDFIINAKMQHNKICSSKNSVLLCDMKDDYIIEEYDAYTATCDLLLLKDRRKLQNKVTDICRDFCIEPDYQYNLSSWKIIFKDKTGEYEYMRQELLQHLGR